MLLLYIDIMNATRSITRPLLWLMALSITSLHADLGRDAGKIGRTGEAGTWIMENSVLFERDRDESFWSIETALAHSPSFLPGTTLLVEASLCEWSKPRNDRWSKGFGDLEFTATHVLFSPEEDSLWPAVSLGGRVKIPTARNRNLGTGKFDYTGILVIGKEIGDFEFNLEFEYTNYGQPGPSSARDSQPAERLKDQLFYKLAIDYNLAEHWTIFTELYGETAASADEGAKKGALLGLEYDIDLNDRTNLFTEISLSTERLFAAKIGLEWSW